MHSATRTRRTRKGLSAGAVALAAAAAVAGCSSTTGGSNTGANASSSAAASSGATASSGAATPAADMVTVVPSLHGKGTSVILDASTLKALTGLGLSIKPLGTATFAAATKTITFPITSGYAEVHSDKAAKPGYIQGSVEHSGSGFLLTAGKTSVALGDFVVDPGNSMLYGTVIEGTSLTSAKAAVKVPLLSLDGRKLQVSKSGSDLVLFGTVAKLTPTAAKALDTAFKTTAVTAGLPLGVVRLVADTTGATTYNASTDKVTAISRLDGVSTSVIVNPSTLAALTKLGVSVAPNGLGTFTAATKTVTFPITGGFAAIHSDKAFKPGYIVGTVIHQGSGLTFSAKGKALALTDFVVDPGNSILTGTVGGKAGVPLLTLDGSKVTVTMQGGNVVLFGTVAKLTATAASALNATFGTTALKAGIPLGTVRLVAKAAS